MTLHRERTRAFSLVEVVIAVGIVTFGIVGIYSLLPAGLRSVEESRNEGLATELLSLAKLDLRNTEPGSSSSLLQVNPYSATSSTNEFLFGKSGSLVTSKNEADFKLTAINRANANPQLATWNLQVAWPARTDNPPNSVETLVILNRLAK